MRNTGVIYSKESLNTTRFAKMIHHEGNLWRNDFRPRDRPSFSITVHEMELVSRFNLIDKLII